MASSQSSCHSSGAGAWPARRPAAPALVLLAALGLAGCASQEAAAPPVPVDYRESHPIVLHEGERTLAVFAAGGPGSIGMRQVIDVRSFAAEYRSAGQGLLTIEVPANGRAARQALPAVRQALMEGGVSRPTTATYHPDTPGAPAPIVLRFARLKADVATECGHWPSDLGISGGDYRVNRPYEDYGCATQSALAQQVADPLDLERARPESAVSTVQRLDTLKKYGSGSPTAVQYPDDTKNAIGKVGG